MVAGASGSWIQVIHMKWEFQKGMNMFAKNKELRSAYLSIGILAFINSGIYGIVYLRSGYYNVVQNAMGLSHIQMGNIWTIYGMIAVVSYLFGGILADKYDSKKLITLSAVGMMAAGGIFWTLPSYNVLILVYIMYAFFAIFTYYPTSVKVVTELGKVIGPGKVFGIYWALIHGSNILASTVGIRIVSLFSGNDRTILRYVIMTYEIVLLIAVLLFLKFFKLTSGTEVKKEKVGVKERAEVLKNPKIRVISLIVFFNYLVISSLSYFTPFIRDILGVSQESVLVINTIKSDILGSMITLSVGFITDKIGSAVKLIGIASLIGAGAIGLFVGSSVLEMPWLVCVILVVFISLVVNGAKNVTMVCVSEAKIPSEVSGRAIGIISFIGYLPDAFYYSIAGRVIEAHGKQGYELLFSVSGLMALLCCLSCYILYQNNRKEEKEL